MAAAYVQDQIALTSQLRGGGRPAVRQLRHRRHQQPHGDGLQQPRRSPFAAARAGLQADRSRYRSTAATALTYLPRAGEQLSSLSLTNQALDPEEFRNYEVGAKWDVNPGLAFTAALYRLDRSNVMVPDPADPTTLDPRRRPADQGPRAGAAGKPDAGLEPGRRLCLPGRRDHAVHLGHRAGRRHAGAAAEALAVTVEQVPGHATDRGRARHHRAWRRLHLDRQPRGPARLGARRCRGVLFLSRRGCGCRPTSRTSSTRTTTSTPTATPTSRRVPRGPCGCR